MEVFFIEQNIKSNLLKKIFKPIDLKKDKIIINKKICKKNLKKIVKEIRKVLEKNNARATILENKLKKNKEFINLLYCENIRIVNRCIFIKMVDNKNNRKCIEKK